MLLRADAEAALLGRHRRPLAFGQALEGALRAAVLGPRMESGYEMTQGRFSAKAKEGMRRSPRLSIELEATLSGRSSRPVTVIDLSISGCLVQCDALLERGTVLDLSIQIDATPFTAKVQVAEACVDGASLTAQAPGFLAGLRFLGMPAAAAMRLRGFLEAERRRRRSAHSPAP